MDKISKWKAENITRRNNNMKNICISLNTKIKNEHPVSLMPHNKKLFDKIIEHINNGEHSIFYSEATGLGKSFIFMRLVYDLFRDKKILYVVPKIVIWENIKMYKEFEYISECVEMTTYADFNSIKDHHYDYDAIFIDECHHLVSDIQGANILTLCDKYIKTGKYVFGFTATPEVKVDKVMVNTDKYFSCKVYGMNIEEAIDSGLFNKIEYAIADPDTIVDDEEYCKRYSIDGTKTLLENILNEHSDIDKWLIYFSNISMLNKNLPSVKKLFPDYKIFILHSKKDDNDEQLKEFNSYQGKTMLLTVSMVLEGIHPKNVKGILLYRNICNYHTLLQVLGRICNINNKTTSPVCVDITQCIYNMSLNYLDDCIVEDDNTEGGERKRRLKSIIDVKASTYRYIELLSNIHKKEYKGITYRSYRELGIKLGKSETYVYQKLNKGYTIEQIIDECLDSKPKCSYRGFECETDVELSLLLGKSRTYVKQKLSNGYTREQIIDECLDGKK